MYLYLPKLIRRYSTQHVAQLLGVGMRNDPRGNTRSDAAKRFLLPINECGFAINSALEDLKPDRWPVESAKQRTQRCTGGALNIAVGLLENCYAGHSGRIISHRRDCPYCAKSRRLRHQAVSSCRSKALF